MSPRTRPLSTILAAAFLAGLGLGASCGEVDPLEQLYAAPGPFTAAWQEHTGPGGAYTLAYPAELGAGGFRHPVLTWGNGTFFLPPSYRGFLEHMATHGYVVVAVENAFVGSGQEMLAGLDYVLGSNDDPQSPFFGVLDVDAAGAFGHSQGGEGTINAANDPRVVCSAPIEPAPGNVTGVVGPMLITAGTLDFIVPASWIENEVYDPSLVPTVYANRKGATHFDPFGDAEGFRGYVTAWFSSCLRGDAQAAQAFFEPCTICSNESFLVQRKNLVP